MFQYQGSFNKVNQPSFRDNSTTISTELFRKQRAEEMNL